MQKNQDNNLETHVSSQLPEEVANFLRRLGGLQGGVVVAVSGGPDSVAILRALLKCRAELIAGPIIIAHLNHMLRGEESQADEEFVRDLYLSLRPTYRDALKFACDRADIRVQATKQRDNLENAARKYRYGWLARTARNQGISWIATGHTADDQAETVLHRLLRGSGIKGLRGIAERRALGPGLFMIRPLLRVSRQEVLQFLESEGQSYRLDSTNLDLRYTRNRIRHELLPFLAKNYTPDIVLKLCRLAEQARATYRRVEERAGALLVRMELPRAGVVMVFDRETIAVAPRNLVREAFRLVWERENWPAHAMTFEHWDRLAAVAVGEFFAVDFPGGIRARCHGRVVQLGQLP
jgi:tRNA(Ile)-lysidine synthase